MYNRYIPQPDGTYRRQRVREPERPKPPEQSQPPEPKQSDQPHREQEPPRQAQSPHHPEQNGPAACPSPSAPASKPPQKPRQPVQGGSIGGFFRQILPSDFDTGDLMVVLLLLLMAADNTDGQNTALLTLVLYLFM